MVTIVGVTDLCWEHISAPGSSKIGHSLLAALVCCGLWLCGWLLCQVELPALYAGGGSQPVALLEHVDAVVLDFEIKNFHLRIFSSLLSPTWADPSEMSWVPG